MPRLHTKPQCVAFLDSLNEKIDKDCLGYVGRGNTYVAYPWSPSDCKFGVV